LHLAAHAALVTTALDFELRAWTARLEEAQEVKSGLGLAILAALSEAGIEIPYGRREVRLVQDEPARAAPRPEEAQ
jgi:small-conductance mechanosensitive channel